MKELKLCLANKKVIYYTEIMWETTKANEKKKQLKI